MSWDRVARPYRFLERLVYGGALQAARVAHLEGIEVEGAPRVLLLGDGDGRFLRAMLERVPEAVVEVVEASAKMIDLAGRDLPDGRGREVTFHHIRIEDFEPDGKKFDLVVSHFFLDCFDEVGIVAIADRVASCLRPGGRWLISDFQMPQRGWFRRLRARLLLWTMYRFFCVVTGLKAKRLVDPQNLLSERGFALESRLESSAGFLRADRWGR